MDNRIGLNSHALMTIAEEMRKQNPEPAFEMNYSEYSAASGIHAMIKGLESLAAGLRAEEEKLRLANEAAYQREIDWMRQRATWGG